MKKIRREETLGGTLQDDVTSLIDSLADIRFAILLRLHMF